MQRIAVGSGGRRPRGLVGFSRETDWRGSTSTRAIRRKGLPLRRRRPAVRRRAGRLAQEARAAQRQDGSQGAGGAADRDGDAAERRSPRARPGRRGECLTSPRLRPDDAAPGPDDPNAAAVHRAAVAAGRSGTAAASRAADAARGSGGAGARRQPRPRQGGRAADQRSPSEARARADDRRHDLASVRRNPRPLADALFPIIGPAIRKAVAATLQRHARVAQHARSSTACRGARSSWRLDARRTGKSFAEIVLLNTLVYRVEQVFLIHRPSGPAAPAPHRAGHGNAGRRHRLGHADGDSRLRAGLLRSLRGRRAADAESRRAVGLDRAGTARAAGGGRARHRAAGAARRRCSRRSRACTRSIRTCSSRSTANAAPFEGARPLLEACLQQQFRGSDRRTRSAPALHGARADRRARARRVAVLRRARPRSLERLSRGSARRTRHRRGLDRTATAANTW